jgi:hypothetical protein
MEKMSIYLFAKWLHALSTISPNKLKKLIMDIQKYVDAYYLFI